MASQQDNLRHNLIASLEGIGVSTASAQAIADSGTLDKYGADAFRYIESNPSLLPFLPPTVQAEVHNKLYDRVIQSGAKAVKEGYLHPDIATPLIETLAYAGNTPQDQRDRDAAYTTLRTSVSRMNAGPGAQTNMRREVQRYDQNLRVLEDTRREVLSPLAAHDYGNGNAITVEPGVTVINGQPHVRVHLMAPDKEGKPTIVKTTMVTATSFGKYKDSQGNEHDKRTLFADAIPMTPVTSPTYIPKAREWEMRVGANSFDTGPDGKIRANVFKSFDEISDEFEGFSGAKPSPGNLAWQQSAAFNILGGGGHPGQTVVKKGDEFVPTSIKSLKSRQTSASAKQSDSDDVLGPVNFAGYYPPEGNSTHSKVELHSKTIADINYSGSFDKQGHSNLNGAVDLTELRRQLSSHKITMNDIPVEVQKHVNAINPVTGEKYDTLVGIGAVTSNQLQTRNSGLILFKPAQVDRGGTATTYDDDGGVAFVDGFKGVKPDSLKSEPQKGLKSYQLGSREMATFYNRDTGDELPRVTGPMRTQGGQEMEGHLINAAFVLSGSQDTDGGFLVERSLGTRKRFEMKVPDGFETDEMQRLNAMADKWLPANQVKIYAGTDKERQIGSGFNETYINSVNEKSVNVTQQGVPFSADTSGEKAFATYSPYVHEYDQPGFDVHAVFNKINDTQAHQFAVLNAVQLARPDEYAQLMAAQFDPQLREQYLRGNSQIQDSDISTIRTDSRRQAGGRYDFTGVTPNDEQWTNETHELHRAMYEDYFMRNTQWESHTRTVSQDRLPTIAPLSMLRTQEERDISTNYWGAGGTPLNNVEDVQYLNRHQANVTTRQLVFRTPFLTSPEPKVAGDTGTVSATDAMLITHARSDDPEVLDRLRSFGADKAFRKGSLIHAAAYNEGANVSPLEGIQLGSELDLAGSMAFTAAANQIAPDDPRRLEKLLALYQEHALGGQDIPTLLHVKGLNGEGDRGFAMPQPSVLTPMIRGTDDADADPEVSSIINALAGQANRVTQASQNGGSTAIGNRLGMSAANGLSVIAAKESTRDSFLGRNSTAARHLPIGGDPQLIAGVSTMEDNQYREYIRKNLQEQGFFPDDGVELPPEMINSQVDAHIQEMENRFLDAEHNNTIIPALDAGILPVANVFRSPHMREGQASFENIMRAGFAKELGISGMEVIPNQLMTSQEAQVAQEGDFDKDTTTTGPAFIKISADGKLVSTVKPTPHAITVARALDPTDPAAQMTTWAEISGTDFQNKTIAGAAQTVAEKQGIRITGRQAMTGGTFNTVESKKQMGQMYNMTMKVRGWWKYVNDKNAISAFRAAEDFRAYNYQLPLDTKALDPGGEMLLSLTGKKVATDIDVVDAFMHSDPKHFGPQQVAEMLVGTHQKERATRVSRIAALIGSGRYGPDRILRALGGSLDESMAGYFGANASYNEITRAYRANQESEHPLSPEEFMLKYNTQKAEKAASINMLIGQGNVYGSGEQSAGNMVGSIALNPDFFPTDEAGNILIREAVEMQGATNDGTGALQTVLAKDDKMAQKNPLGQAYPGPQRVFDTGGSGDEPPDMPHFDDLQVPDDDGSSNGNGNGAPQEPLNARVYPPIDLSQIQGGMSRAQTGSGNDRFFLEASNLTLQGAMGTLTGANGLGSQSFETGMKSILSSVPFDIREKTGDKNKPYNWKAFARAAGVGQKILERLGIKSAAPGIQGRKNSMYYGESSEFQPGLEWTAQNGQTINIHGNAPHVDDGMITNISFATANMSPEDVQRRRMQQIAYMQTSGARKSRTAFYDINKFVQHLQEQTNGGVTPERLKEIFANQDSFDAWMKKDKRYPGMVAGAYDAAFTGYGQDLDFSEPDAWTGAMAEFNQGMEQINPAVQAYAAAQQAQGLNYYETEPKLGEPRTYTNVPVISHISGSGNPTAVNKSMEAMANFTATLPPDEQAKVLSSMGVSDTNELAQGLNGPPALLDRLVHPAAQKNLALPQPAAKTQVNAPTQVAAPAPQPTPAPVAPVAAKAAPTARVSKAAKDLGAASGLTETEVQGIKGSGKNGNILKSDVEAYIASNPVATVVAQPSNPDDEEPPEPFDASNSSASSVEPPDNNMPAIPPGAQDNGARSSDQHLKKRVGDGFVNRSGLNVTQVTGISAKTLRTAQRTAGQLRARGSSGDLLARAQELSAKPVLTADEAKELDAIQSGFSTISAANAKATEIIEAQNAGVLAQEFGNDNDRTGEQQLKNAERVKQFTQGFGFDEKDGLGNQVLQTRTKQSEMAIGTAQTKAELDKAAEAKSRADFAESGDIMQLRKRMSDAQEKEQNELAKKRETVVKAVDIAADRDALRAQQTQSAREDQALVDVRESSYQVGRGLKAVKTDAAEKADRLADLEALDKANDVERARREKSEDIKDTHAVAYAGLSSDEEDNNLWAAFHAEQASRSEAMAVTDAKVRQSNRMAGANARNVKAKVAQAQEAAKTAQAQQIANRADGMDRHSLMELGQQVNAGSASEEDEAVYQAAAQKWASYDSRNSAMGKQISREFDENPQQAQGAALLYKNMQNVGLAVGDQGQAYMKEAAEREATKETGFLQHPLDNARIEAQISSIGSMNADLKTVEEAFTKVGQAAKGAYDPTMKLVEGVKSQAVSYSDMVEKLRHAEKVQDSSPVAKEFLAAHADIWENGEAKGGLAEMGNRLLGEIDPATGKRTGGVYQTALKKEFANSGGTMPEEPDFRDKLAPFLQSGKAGRQARQTGISQGWYGADDQGKGEMSLGWKIGGTALGTLNNAVLGYRMFRNIAQETIAPFQEDQQIYQQSQTARAMAAMQSGMLNITQPGEQQLSYVRYANNTLQTQRNIGQSFQNAWMPLQSMLTGGAEGPNTATEAAAIGGPAIGAGVAASFATGNPLIGVAVGLGAAAIGEAGTLSSDAKSQQTRLATRRGIGTDLGSGLAYSLTHVNETLSLVGQSDSQVQADYRTQAQIDRLAHGGAINGVSADVLSQAQQEWITNNQDSIKNLPSELQYQALSQVTSYFGNMPSSGTSGTGVGGHDDNQFAKDVSFVGAAAQNGVDISSALQASVSRFGPQTSQFKNAAYQKGLTDLSNINDKFNLVGISTVGYMGNLAAPSQQAQYTMGLPITDVMKMATDYLNAPTNSTTFERRDGGTSRVLGKDAVLRQDIGTFQLNSLQAQGAGLTSSNISGILGNAGQYNTGLASDASKFQAALGQVPDQLSLTNRLQTQYGDKQGVADLLANLGASVSPFVSGANLTNAESYITSTGMARVGMSKSQVGQMGAKVVQAQAQSDIDARAFAMASEAGANTNDAQTMVKYRKLATDALDKEANGGISSAQSGQLTTESGWAGAYNAGAGQGGQSYLSNTDFTGLRSQNAAAIVGVGAISGQQGASGLGVMSGALGFITDLFKQNTDASLKLGNQIQSQTQQASQMFQSYAAYGGATSQHMAQLQQIAMDPNAARAQANLAIGQGDPIAMSQFAAAHPGSPSFMQQLQVSGKKGTTIGAQAGYDETPNADLQSALLTVDTKYGGFMQSDAKAAGFNMGSFNQMSMVQTQAAITGYQTQLFNMQNAAADTGLQRQRNLVTGQGAWTVGVGDDGKAANLASSAGLDSTVDAITGKTLSSLIKGVSQWGLEDQGTILQRQQQDWSYQQQTAQLGINQSQFALQGTQFGENQAFQQQQNTFNWGVQQQQMELGRTQQVQQSQWQMQDLKFGAAKESVNFGWQMQDYDRQMRFARGQDKVDLERNRSRAVVSYAMDMGQTNTQEGRVTTQANQATQGYQLQVKSFNQQKQFTEESMQLDKKHFDQNRALQQQQMNLEVQDHQKQLQFLQEQRSQEDQSRALQRASFLVTQKDAENQQKVSEKAALALKALNDRMDDFSRRSTEAQQTSNYLAKIGGILDQINPKVTTFETDLQNAVVPMNNLVQSVRALINSLAAGANAENKATQAASNMQKLQAKTGAGAALGGVVNYPSMLNNYTPDLSPLTTSGSKYSPAGQITVHGGETIYPSGSSPNSGNPDDSANLEKIASGINQLVQQGTVRPSINVSSNNSRSGVAGALSAYDLMKGRFKQ